MTKVYSASDKIADTEEIYSLCGRLYYITATHGISIPPRLAGYLPSFGVNWRKAHLGRSASYIEGLSSLADSLYQAGQSQGEVINPITESREVLRRIFLEHILPNRSVDPRVIDDLASFGATQALMTDRVLSGKELLHLDIEKVKEHILPTPSPLLSDLYGEYIWPGIHIFGADPGHGKTTLMVHFMIEYAKKNIPVILVETELSEVIFYLRFHDVFTQLPEDVLSRFVVLFGGIDVGKVEQIIDSHGFERSPLLIMDIPDSLIGLFDDARKSLNYIYSQLAMLQLDHVVSSVFTTSHLVRDKRDGDRLAESSFKNRIASSVVEFEADETLRSDGIIMVDATLKKNRFGQAFRSTRVMIDVKTLEVRNTDFDVSIV